MIRVFPCLVLVALAFAVGAWGNFPINDDWQYAHVAKQLAETGVMRVDVAIAPSVVGQAALASPFLHWLGFSHTLLRALTLGLACLCLLFLERILGEVEVSPRLRLISLTLLALSPLFAYLSFTFMTEIWGLAPALAAVWIWTRAGRGGARPQWALLAAGVLLGGAFWIRQLSSLFFPALVGAAWLRALPRGPRALATEVARTLPAALVFGALIWGYFAWARATGNLRPEFSVPMDRLLDFDRRAWLVEGGAFVLYATAFCLPLLVVLPWRGTRAGLVAGVLFVGVVLLGLRELQLVVPHNHLHPRFPVLTNVIHETGLGPVTLTETPRHYLPGGGSIWIVVQWLLAAGALLWAAALRWLPMRDENGRAPELILACLLLPLANLVFAVQAYKLEVFDRYHLAGFVMLALAVTVAVDRASRWRPIPRWRLGLGLAAALPIAFFTIAGLRDQFAWMSARATLYRRALAAGISPANLDGGYELNGWYAFVEKPRPFPPSRCIGPCGTRQTWYVTDDSHRIGFTAEPGYTVVEAIEPGFWILGAERVVWTTREAR